MDPKWLLVIFFSILGAALGSLSNYLYKYYMLTNQTNEYQIIQTGEPELNFSIKPKTIEIISILSLCCYLLSCSICSYVIYYTFRNRKYRK